MSRTVSFMDAAHTRSLFVVYQHMLGSDSFSSRAVKDKDGLSCRSPIMSRRRGNCSIQDYFPSLVALDETDHPKALTTDPTSPPFSVRE